MQEAFGVLIFVVVALAAVVAIVGLVARGGPYDEIGRGGLTLDRPPPEPASPVAHEAEIRQMLQAANERRVSRGQEPRDVEAELARLTRPAADPELEREVRALVEARNERRARRGEPPLDVEAELRRRLDALV